MSAPDTNIKKQEKRHAGPLIGIGAGVVFAGILLFAFLSFQVDPAETEAGEEAPAAATE
ncbi:MAG: hypothetical protein AAF264_01495 [Pseudomonadota bacterium]